MSTSDSKLNLENKDFKFEKRILERLIKDQEAQLERLSRSLRALSVVVETTEAQ